MKMTHRVIRRASRWPALTAVMMTLVVMTGCSGGGLELESSDGILNFRTEPWPPRARVAATLIVEPGAGMAVAAGDLTAEFDMPGMGHGATVVDLASGGGRFRGSVVIDHGGTWEVRIIDSQGRVLAEFDLDVEP